MFLEVICICNEVSSLLLQDSLRYLVQDSLAAFTQLILDACFMVQDLPADLDWGSDIINSPFKLVLLYTNYKLKHLVLIKNWLPAIFCLSPGLTEIGTILKDQHNRTPRMFCGTLIIWSKDGKLVSVQPCARGP